MFLLLSSCGEYFLFDIYSENFLVNFESLSIINWNLFLTYQLFFFFFLIFFSFGQYFRRNEDSRCPWHAGGPAGLLTCCGGVLSRFFLGVNREHLSVLFPIFWRCWNPCGRRCGVCRTAVEHWNSTERDLIELSCVCMSLFLYSLLSSWKTSSGPRDPSLSRPKICSILALA